MYMYLCSCVGHGAVLSTFSAGGRCVDRRCCNFSSVLLVLCRNEETSDRLPEEKLSAGQRK